MKTSTLYIKNMVCPRCIQVVGEVCADFGLMVQNVMLGRVEIAAPEKAIDLPALNAALQKRGFELLVDKEAQMTAKIKSALIEYLDEIEKSDKNDIRKLSGYLAATLHTSYSQLTKQFSHATDTTIEKFWVALKVERVKELLSYDELTLSEIAFRLDYSSVQYLSTQFKNLTGVTPSEYKSQQHPQRKSIDRI